MAFLDQWLPGFVDAAFLRNVAASLIFFFIAMLARSLARRAILRRNDLRPEIRQRWLANVGNAMFVIVILGMALMWASEIETLAVSLVAIAAAIVLATKEMIMCFLGSFYRASTQAYSVGDRIEINGLKGQVIDSTLLSTKLLESVAAVANKATVGRIIVFPNSLLLTHPVSNETELGDYVLHNVTVNLNRGEDWQRIENALLAAANKEVASYANDLTKHARDIKRGHGIETPTLSPRVRVALDNRESISLFLQLPVPLSERAAVEQRILRAALSEMPADC